MTALQHNAIFTHDMTNAVPESIFNKKEHVIIKICNKNLWLSWVGHKNAFYKISL